MITLTLPCAKCNWMHTIEVDVNNMPPSDEGSEKCVCGCTIKWKAEIHIDAQTIEADGE